MLSDNEKLLYLLTRNKVALKHTNNFDDIFYGYWFNSWKKYNLTDENFSSTCTSWRVSPLTTYPVSFEKTVLLASLRLLTSKTMITSHLSLVLLEMFLCKQIQRISHWNTYKLFWFLARHELKAAGSWLSKNWPWNSRKIIVRFREKDFFLIEKYEASSMGIQQFHMFDHIFRGLH